MDIGKEGEPIKIEPLKVPVPREEPAPSREPLRRKTAPEPRPRKVPDKVPAK